MLGSLENPVLFAAVAVGALCAADGLVHLRALVANGIPNRLQANLDAFEARWERWTVPIFAVGLAPHGALPARAARGRPRKAGAARRAAP